MQIISTMVLYDYKVPVIIKKNFTFCFGKSRENFPNIFQDFPGLINKIQGFSRAGKNPGLFQESGNPVILALEIKRVTRNSPTFLA